MTGGTSPRTPLHNSQQPADCTTSLNRRTTETETETQQHQSYPQNGKASEKETRPAAILDTEGQTLSPRQLALRTMDNNTIYAIYDNVAKSLAGGLYLHKHEASAVRFFADVASDPQTMVAKHPQDFDLVRLGHLRDLVITQDYATVLKGSTWIAAHTAALEEENQQRALTLQRA